MQNEARADGVTVQGDPRWIAVLTRDVCEDGHFFYAVTSTGIYCRPSCGARTPRPENVRFYDTIAEAEAAGFRPCRRCRPDAPGLRQGRIDLVIRACRLIAQAEQPPRLADLAQQLGVGAYHLHRIFRELTGLTPHAYADTCRAERVRAGLSQGLPVTDAIFAAGFESGSRFYAQSMSHLGMTAGRYRAGGDGAAIRFAVGQCWLGAILVAATAHGVCAILLGDDASKLLGDLQVRFPKAELIGGDAGFERLVAQVVGFVQTPRAALQFPIDVAGTIFQRKVWQALQAIPPGSTITYAELARRIGQPSAIRAVAGACAANPVAVAIPCHRVVRSDGGLSGYCWGIERKRALLDREAEG